MRSLLPGGYPGTKVSNTSGEGPITPIGVPVTRPEDTSEVSGPDCGPQRAGDQALGPAHVQGPGLGIEDDSGQIGITSKTSDFVNGEEGPVAGLRNPGPPQTEDLGGDMDRDVGSVGRSVHDVEKEVGTAGRC